MSKRNLLIIAVIIITIIIVGCEKVDNNKVDINNESVESSTDEVKPKEEVEVPKEDRLKDSITVEAKDAKLIPKNTDAWRFSDMYVWNFRYTNNTEKDVVGFKGIFVVKDLFGDTIKRIGLEHEKGIPAKGYYDVSEIGIELNEFMHEDNKLKDYEKEKLQYEFEMIDIIFTDGERLGGIQ